MSLLEERLQAPTHFGAMEAPSAVGAVGNPACGDVLTLYLRIREGIIEEASFESIGSRFQLATASVLCDCVEGLRIDEAKERSAEDLLDKLPGLPPRNRYLARLAGDALRRALHRYAHGAKPQPGSDLKELTPEQARRFVASHLQARSMATLEIEAMAEAEGYHLPGGTARCLSKLKREGFVVSRMSDDRRSWRWQLATGQQSAA